MIGAGSRNFKRGYKYIRGGLTNLVQLLSGYSLMLRQILRVKSKKTYCLNACDMLGVPRRHSLNLAEKVVNGQLAVDFVFKDAPAYSTQKFDWNIAFSDAATTFQLYVQALNPVGDLAAAYNSTKKNSYFELAKWFLNSWRNYSKSTSSLSNEYIWEHLAVALRTENMLYFFLVGCENDKFTDSERRSIAGLLEMHGDFLAHPKNYLDEHNHGVFQDKALIYLATSFSRQDWIQTAQNRLNRQWNFLFNDEMVCVENSYTYQRVNIDLFLEVARFQQQQGNDWGDDLIYKLSLAQDFMGHGLRPNGTCAPFGDTFIGDYTGCSFISEQGVLAYASRKGMIGKKPNVRSIVYPKSGYYFGREHWLPENNSNKFEDAIWTMFRSGYTSITHRQADDNSFMLYAKNHEIFVDPGLYTYMHRNPIRMYVRSANAHNTVIVDEISFPFLREDCVGLSGMIHHDVGLDKGYDYVVGHNSMYLGVFHVRHFIFLENALFILDELESVHDHCFSQLFHCGKDIALEEVNGNGMRGIIADTGFQLRLQQLHGTPSATVINGGDKDARYGFCSDAFNEYHFIDTVKFDLCGRNVQFATLITFDQDSTGDHDKSSVVFDHDLRTLSFVNHGELKALPLKQFKRQAFIPWQALVMENYEIFQNGPVFTLTNYASYKEKIQYAWYIIRKKTRKPIKKQMYTDSPSFTIDFAEYEFGEYSIQAFIMNPINKKIAKQVICHINYEDGVCTYRRELELDCKWLKSCPSLMIDTKSEINMEVAP